MAALLAYGHPPKPEAGAGTVYAAFASFGGAMNYLSDLQKFFATYYVGAGAEKRHNAAWDEVGKYLKWLDQRVGFTTPPAGSRLAGTLYRVKTLSRRSKIRAPE